MQTESEARLATAKDVEGGWTTRDLAEYFGVPIQTVSKAANRGSIPGCAKVLGRYVFDRVESLKWEPAALTVLKGGPSRDGQGKFAKGNAIGVGNRGGRPTRDIELQFLSTLVGTVAAKDWQDIIIKAVEQAKTGDWKARQWLGNYLLGTPVQRVQVDADIVAKQEFSVGEQAAAILALLETVREREEAKVIDADLRPA